MKRVSALVGVMLLALGAHANVARAMTIEGRNGGEVRSLSVIPAAGRAEVVVALAGSVDVQDFSLASLKALTFEEVQRRYEVVSAMSKF